MRLSKLDTFVAQSTQECVLDFVTEHGRKRGLALFAQKVGVTERRARSFAEGTAGRIDASEFLAAQQARAEILRLRIARAQHQLHQIEVTHGAAMEPAAQMATEGHGLGAWPGRGDLPFGGQGPDRGRGAADPAGASLAGA